MKKLPYIFAASLLGLVTLAASTAQAQSKLPPWIGGKTETPAPQPAPQPAPTTQPSQTTPPVYGESRPDVAGRIPEPGSPEYSADRNRKGHPHGMPPGQAKKYGYRANPSNGGLPPGQAKKAYRGPAAVPGTVYMEEQKHEHKGKGKGHGKGKR
ncbi:hypothetical protein GCM10023185_03120 [Hymenobacter saemangeumensis]|uniref:Uncharacterized protein n=1 Tax=Hymenobacter saemangeumensis TaxID=1084522 RepID=A0ABP8HYX6_9BACT